LKKVRRRLEEDKKRIENKQGRNIRGLKMIIFSEYHH
jgi:hypothetical protein